MAGASDTIDPIDAARNDIAGSKDLIASAVEDLSQHQRWLENYRVAETKRAKRIRRQELMHQAELTTKRIIRALRRFAVLLARTVRAISRFTIRVAVIAARAVTTATSYLYGLLRSAIAWTAPRAYALARAAARLIAAAFAWTLLKAGALARATLEGAALAYAWAAPKVRAFARATSRATAASLSFIGARAYALAVAFGNATSTGLTWIAAQSHALTVASLRALSAGLAWTGAKGRQASLVVAKQARQTAIGLKRSTLATEQWVRTRWNASRNATALSVIEADPPAKPPEPQSEGAGIQRERSMPNTALMSDRRRRSKPRAVRASRRELRQRPRVIGRR